MSRNPNRITCRCGQGKVSAWDGKCGHCRTKREREALRRMHDGWPKEAAQRGWLTEHEKNLRAAQSEFSPVEAET